MCVLLCCFGISSLITNCVQKSFGISSSCVEFFLTDFCEVSLFCSSLSGIFRLLYFVVAGILRSQIFPGVGCDGIRWFDFDHRIFHRLGFVRLSPAFSGGFGQFTFFGDFCAHRRVRRHIFFACHSVAQYASAETANILTWIVDADPQARINENRPAKRHPYEINDQTFLQPKTDRRNSENHPNPDIVCEKFHQHTHFTKKSKNSNKSIWNEQKHFHIFKFLCTMNDQEFLTWFFQFLNEKFITNTWTTSLTKFQHCCE